MSLVTTLPVKGEQPKVYEIPDADLGKYQVVEGKKDTYAEGKDKLASGKELAGGIDLEKADVQAYSDICICWYYWYGVWYYRYVYCWQWC
jgi:hypothetical protein